MRVYLDGIDRAIEKNHNAIAAALDQITKKFFEYFMLMAILIIVAQLILKQSALTVKQC
jgi:hypothetical protein